MGRQGSNLLPAGPEPAALPGELHPNVLHQIIIHRTGFPWPEKFVSPLDGGHALDESEPNIFLDPLGNNASVVRPTQPTHNHDHFLCVVHETEGVVVSHISGLAVRQNMSEPMTCSLANQPFRIQLVR